MILKIIYFSYCAQKETEAQRSKFLKTTQSICSILKPVQSYELMHYILKQPRTCSGQRENIPLQFIEVGMRIIA